jgi:hypothetical protein
MIRLDNFAEFVNDIDAWVEAMEELAEGALRGLAVYAFNYIMEGTPEWSGELVAQWKLTVGSPAQGYSETPFKNDAMPALSANNESPYSVLSPNPAAVHYAKAIAREALPLIQLGAEVFISNTTPYGLEVEMNEASDGQAFLRPVNLVDGRVQMLHAAHEKFSAVGQISGPFAIQLAGATL